MPAIPRPEYGQSQVPATLPVRRHKYETPKLRLQLNDLGHEGSSNFLSNIKGNEDIEQQVQNVLNLLYSPDSHRPGTRSVTFILRDMGGVAYTTELDIDNDHKEIHVSLRYIQNKPRHEILGVVCHELVHCFQWNANGSCPGGLIEGIADWVRLRAGLAAKHWKQEADGKWDAGYQHTGYFLEYLENRFGPGTVSSINGCLRKGDYDEEKVFGTCCDGKKVENLWCDYGEDLKRKKRREDERNVTHCAQEAEHER